MNKLSKRLKIILIIDFILLLICLLGMKQNIQKAGLEPQKHIAFKVEGKSVYVSKIRAPELKNIFWQGDKLLLIDGRKVSRKEDIEFILDSHSIGDSVQFSLLREERHVNLQVKLPSYYNLYDNLTQIFVGLVFLILGLFVINKRPELLMANIWHWASVWTAVIITLTWGNYSAGVFNLGQLNRLFFFIAYAFVPTLFVHLSFVFPRYKWQHLKKLTYPLYGFSALLAIFMSITFLSASQSISVDWFHYHMNVFDLNRLYFAIAMVFGVINIFQSSINAQEESERRQIRWVVFGLAIGPPSFVFFWQMPQLMGFDSFIPEAILLQIMLIIPITFSIAIVKYHAFNIDHIFRRSTVYVFMAFFLLVVYAALVGLSVLFVGFITVESSLVTTVIAAILTPIFFEPIRRGLQKLVDKKFFRVQYNYRVAQRHFTQELNESYDKNTIVQIAIRKIDDLLQLKYSAIYIKNEISSEIELAASKNFDQFDKGLIKDIYKQAQNSNQTIFTHQNIIESGLEFEDLNIPNDNKKYTCLATPLKDPKNDVIGILILGRKKSGQKYTHEDIDLLRTVGIQLGLAIQRTVFQKQLLLKNLEAEHLNELNQLKSYFVSSVSHDLQSPLTSIRMFAELLNEKKNIPESKRSEYLEIIEGESSRLSRLISNVLDFSKIERGIKEYHFKKLNINTVLKNVVKIMDYQLSQQNFEVNENYSKNEIILNADEDALISICINLISNVIKYSADKKSIFISTEVENEDVVVKFTDEGVGISSEDQQHIFETFYRSKDENIQSSGGAGLGLTLVKHVVEAHNGKVEVESKPGQGSTFILYFPIGEIKN
ncbi:MAG: GAF domain-containing protein [Calditrichaeota bacterium]|nr:MAG: GAF domain-containing protein [Calditrichota bacterium]MBL1207804.1 GAF domain-containing protein [Calditrichota bacterium]NOG47638.1 GAF domain-containing protein [Calditrichota bacterium]